MKRNIIKNLKYLRQQSQQAEEKEVNPIIQDLEDTLKDYSIGIGLSAIQIGIPKRVGIVWFKTKKEKDKDFKLTLVNPKIIEKSGRFKFKKESCLSFPGLRIETVRYNYITIQNDGREEKYVGLVAVCIQHEIDHFNGIIILDRKWSKR